MLIENDIDARPFISQVLSCLRPLLRLCLLKIWQILLGCKDIDDALHNGNFEVGKRSKVMRQRRIDRGALTLASAEVKFQIDTETHDSLDIDVATTMILTLGPVIDFLLANQNALEPRNINWAKLKVREAEKNQCKDIVRSEKTAEYSRARKRWQTLRLLVWTFT
ncbi:unnamed protein product [Camellia sinensis]